jgi:hypothetical protein
MSVFSFPLVSAGKSTSRYGPNCIASHGRLWNVCCNSIVLLQYSGSHTRRGSLPGNSVGYLPPISWGASCANISAGAGLYTCTMPCCFSCSTGCGSMTRFFLPFSFLLIFSTRYAMIASSITRTAAPAPIPAFAPVLSPALAVSGVAEEAAVCEVLVIEDVAVVDALVADALVIADLAVDAGAAIPTVAANMNRLELIPQQLLSPQHQLLSPHFLTGA